MKKINFNIVVFALVTFVSSLSLYAQAEVSLGTDVVSRYVWRGTDFGQTPSIQPALDFTARGFSAGFWGAYQLGRDASSLPADELDFYLGYSLELGSANLDLVVTDYYFPNSGIKFGNYEDGTGAHIIEVGGTVSLSDFYLAGFVNVYNDADNSSYFELGYSTSVQSVDLSLFAGATPGGTNMYYGTTDFNFVNVGVTASKEIKITDDFSLPIFGSYILNPNQEIAHFVFGISL
jgi:hypothetical protein